MIKNNNWFSLIELLVVIAIIGIIVVWASRIDFNPQIDKQNFDMFTNNVFTSIETVRNNALLGKWVGSGSIFTHPEKWVIKLSSVWTGSIQAEYQSGTNIYPLWDFRVDFVNQNTKISELRCKSIDGPSLTGSLIDIEISGKTMSFSGCSNDQKILQIKTEYKNFHKVIEVNSITWLIEKL